MSAKTIREATKALQATFSAPKVPAALPPDSRRLLQNFIDEHEGKITDEDSARTNLELKNFWERDVSDSPAKLAVFVGVLRELRPAITGETQLLAWWSLVVKPVITGTGYKKAALDDAREFLVDCLVADEDDGGDDRQHSPAMKRLLSDLVNIYLSDTRGLTEEDSFIAPENAQVARQVESVLIAYGRKEPKHFFTTVDQLITAANTRLQALTLLSTFLTEPAPRIYMVIDTLLVESLLKSLMNDTSTTVLSAALTCLIMLLPHIPGDLVPHLPRMFLIYSRLLCWEKFSPLSTEAQRGTVTDDRVSARDDADRDPGDVGIDPSWQKVQPKDLLMETATPELMDYFTYLYGLYPLNFMSYVRKPRRYLKNVSFPGADDFDLDQRVIRSRTELFRQVHLLHPSFFNMTIDEEPEDSRWSKMDPADVVAECYGLCVPAKPTLASLGPPPTSKLPDLPPLPPLTPTNTKKGFSISPVVSHASFRSGNSWRDTQITAVAPHATDSDIPTLRPQGAQSDDEAPSRDWPSRLRSKASASNRTSPDLDSFPLPMRSYLPPPTAASEPQEAPSTNLAFLQREITDLRTKLNFEKWHKASYGQHIGQMMRKNVKDATVEAETLNLINANHALKLQLEQVRNAREATIKDSTLTRKQANSIETNLTERLNKMQLEQDQWRADAEELRRLRAETKQYREVLVATEVREMSKAHQLEIVRREVEKLRDVQKYLGLAEQRVRELEYREWEFDRAKREQEILLNEKKTLQTIIQRHEQDRERTRCVYADKVAELESRLDGTGEVPVRQPSQRNYQALASPDTQILVQQAIAESKARLVQLKKAHARLLEKYTDLELEYQAVRSELDALQGNETGHGVSFDLISTPRVDAAYDILTDDYLPISDQAYTISSSDPTQRRYVSPASLGGLPVTPLTSEAAVQSGIGLAFKPIVGVTRQHSIATASLHSTGGRPATAFNQTASLSRFGDGSVSTGSEDGGKRGEKIAADSQVRVYGRGGAQNIKMKAKDKDKDGSEPTGSKKTGGGPFKALKRLV